MKKLILLGCITCLIITCQKIELLDSNIYNCSLSGIAYGHTGNTSAYNTLLFYFPNKQVTLSFGFNGASEQDDIGKKLTDTYKKFSEVIFK